MSAERTKPAPITTAEPHGRAVQLRVAPHVPHARSSFSTHRSAFSSASRSSFIIHHSSFFAPGFTLIELMATIVIIGILASMFLGAFASAQKAANIANTQALISKLNSQLMLRYETYRTRRIPLNTASLTPRQAAALRLQMVREMMRLELPDRYSDIPELPSGIPNPLIATPSNPGASDPDPVILYTTLSGSLRVPSLSIALSYSRRLQNAPKATVEYEDAECLYMIITTGLADDSVGNEQISTENVGDVDGDGMPEFIDVWGQPIRFIRWAPGFGRNLLNPTPVLPTSDDSLQPCDKDNIYTVPGNPPTPKNDPRFVMTRHDPFDPLKLHAVPQFDSNNPPTFLEEGFALTPLIYSAGPDKVIDLFHGPSSNDPLKFNYRYTSFSVTFPGGSSFPYKYNPYSLVKAPSGQMLQIGMPYDTDGDGDSGGWADNITNHLIGP